MFQLENILEVLEKDTFQDDVTYLQIQERNGYNRTLYGFLGAFKKMIF